jgi:hypothetical protein
MKTMFVMMALVMMSVSCGKKDSKKNQWSMEPYTIDPMTGQVTVVRAPPIINARVFVNESERSIYFLETKTRRELVAGISCYSHIQSGMTRYDLSSDGRTLTIYSRYGNQTYTRTTAGSSIIGSTWIGYQNNRTFRQDRTYLTFTSHDYVNLITECSR